MQLVIPRKLPMRAGSQGQRLQQTETAETEVRQPALAVDLNVERDVRAGNDALSAEPDSCLQKIDRKSEPFQHGCEKQVLFETVTATAITDDFGLQTVEVEADRPFEDDVEILERDMRGVCQVQAAERVEIGVPAAVVRNPIQVGVEIELRWIRG